jgi:hypothetical protein
VDKDSNSGIWYPHGYNMDSIYYLISADMPQSKTDWLWFFHGHLPSGLAAAAGPPGQLQTLAVFQPFFPGQSPDPDRHHHETGTMILVLVCQAFDHVINHALDTLDMTNTLILEILGSPWGGRHRNHCLEQPQQKTTLQCYTLYWKHFLCLLMYAVLLIPKQCQSELGLQLSLSKTHLVSAIWTILTSHLDNPQYWPWTDTQVQAILQHPLHYCRSNTLQLYLLLSALYPPDLVYLLVSTRPSRTLSDLALPPGTQVLAAVMIPHPCHPSTSVLSSPCSLSLPSWLTPLPAPSSPCRQAAAAR